MMVMTAKVDFRKILVALIAIAGVIVALILLLQGPKDEPAVPSAAVNYSSNDQRVQFLTDFGWNVSASATESGQVRIPEETTELFDRYNALQKSQGYDLNNYAGKTAMRYVYTVNNYPNATEPVYATLLVYKDQIIGGDITNTASDGVVQTFRMPKTDTSPAPTEAPTESTVPEARDSVS
jgi:hypothetical protein